MMTSSDSLAPLVAGLEKALNGEPGIVPLFCLHHLTMLALKREKKATTPYEVERDYTTLRPRFDVILTENQFVQAADLLRPLGVTIAKTVWESGSLRDEDHPRWYVFFSAETQVETILKLEYYRDFSDMYEGRLEKIY